MLRPSSSLRSSGLHRTAFSKRRPAQSKSPEKLNRRIIAAGRGDVLPIANVGSSTALPRPSGLQTLAGVRGERRGWVFPVTPSSDEPSFSVRSDPALQTLTVSNASGSKGSWRNTVGHYNRLDMVFPISPYELDQPYHALYPGFPAANDLDLKQFLPPAAIVLPARGEEPRFGVVSDRSEEVYPWKRSSRPF